MWLFECFAAFFAVQACLVFISLASLSSPSRFCLFVLPLRQFSILIELPLQFAVKIRLTQLELHVKTNRKSQIVCRLIHIWVHAYLNQSTWWENLHINLQGFLLQIYLPKFDEVICYCSGIKLIHYLISFVLNLVEHYYQRLEIEFFQCFWFNVFCVGGLEKKLLKNVVFGLVELFCSRRIQWAWGHVFKF